MSIPFPRLIAVELRKMVDTRAGFWLQVAVLSLMVVLVALFCVFAETEDLILRETLSLATLPAALLLPIVGILLVTSEWSQRTALITFTLVPRRLRVMGAKVTASLVLGTIAMAFATVVAVVAVVLSGGEWTMGAGTFGQIVLLCLTAVLTGVAFGAAFLTSAPAIVLYFVLPLGWTALGSIPALNDAAQWLDTSRTTAPMTERLLSGEEWAQLGTSMALWLALPMAIGLWRIAKGEIRAA